MTWRTKTNIFALALAIGFGNCATADDAVILVNGDRITGQIESVTENLIRLRSEHLGEMLIPRNSVASFKIEKKTVPAIQKTITDAGNYGQWTNVTLSILTATPAITNSNSVDFVQLLAIQKVLVTTPPPSTPAVGKLWKSSIDLGLTLSQAAHDTRNFTFQFESKYEKKPSQLHLQALAFWGDNDGVTTTQKAEARAKYEWDWMKHSYWYDQLNAAYDRFRGLNLELQESAGAGYRLIDSPHQKLSIDGGPAYLLLVQNNGQQNQALSLRSSQKYHCKINEMVSFHENLEVIQRTDFFAARQLRAELALTGALTRKLSWKMTLLDEYATRPVSGTPANSLQFISSLGIKF